MASDQCRDDAQATAPERDPPSPPPLASPPWAAALLVWRQARWVREPLAACPATRSGLTCELGRRDAQLAGGGLVVVVGRRSQPVLPALGVDLHQCAAFEEEDPLLA